MIQLNLLKGEVKRASEDTEKVYNLADEINAIALSNLSDSSKSKMIIELSSQIMALTQGI